MNEQCPGSVLVCQLECFDYPHFHNSLIEWQVGLKWVSGFGKGAKCVFLDGSTGLGFYGLCMEFTSAELSVHIN